MFMMFTLLCFVSTNSLGSDKYSCTPGMQNTVPTTRLPCYTDTTSLNNQASNQLVSSKMIRSGCTGRCHTDVGSEQNHLFRIKKMDQMVSLRTKGHWLQCEILLHVCLSVTSYKKHHFILATVHGPSTSPYIRAAIGNRHLALNILILLPTMADN